MFTSFTFFFASSLVYCSFTTQVCVCRCTAIVCAIAIVCVGLFFCLLLLLLRNCREKNLDYFSYHHLISLLFWKCHLVCFISNFSSMEISFHICAHFLISMAVWKRKEKTHWKNRDYFNWNENLCNAWWFMIKILRNLSFICFPNVLTAHH